MHRAFFTFAAFVTGSMMEGCPGHLVHLVNSATKCCPSSAAISSSSNSNSLRPCTLPHRSRRLVRHQPSPPSCRRSRPRDRQDRLTLSPSVASLVVPTISSTFSSKSAITKFRKARQTKMADVDCIWTFVRIYYPTGRRRLVCQQPSPPSCRRSHPRHRRSRPRRTLSPPAASLVVSPFLQHFPQSPPSQNFAMLAKQRWRMSIRIYIIDT